MELFNADFQYQHPQSENLPLWSKDQNRHNGLSQTCTAIAILWEATNSLIYMILGMHVQREMCD